MAEALKLPSRLLVDTLVGFLDACFVRELLMWYSWYSLRHRISSSRRHGQQAQCQSSTRRSVRGSNGSYLQRYWISRSLERIGDKDLYDWHLDFAAYVPLTHFLYLVLLTTGIEWGIYDSFKIFMGLPTTGGAAPPPKQTANV